MDMELDPSFDLWLGFGLPVLSHAVLRTQSLGSHPGSTACSLCDLASPSLGFDLCKVRVMASDSEAVVALPEVTYVKHLPQLTGAGT